MTTDTNAATAAMVQGRRADSARRRQRVLTALNDAVNNGEEISVSGIAHRAGVDRTFLYRHRDLLEHVHATEAQPRNTTSIGPQSAEPPCRPTCSPPSDAPPAWPHNPPIRNTG